MLSVGNDLAERVNSLEALRDVAYAIVLLPGPGEADGAQDALLEIGFLLGTLGTARLCFLAPADAPALPGLDAVTRQAMDGSGLWRLLLAREMKRAGLDIDMNRAI